MNRLYTEALVIVLALATPLWAMPAEDFVAQFGNAPPTVAPEALPRRDVLWTRATGSPVSGGMSGLERDRCQSLVRVQRQAQEIGYRVLELDRPVTLAPRPTSGLLNTRTDLDIVLEKGGRHVVIEHKYYPDPSRPLRLTEQVRMQMHTQAAVRQMSGYDAYIYFVDGHTTDDVVKHARSLGYRVVRSSDELASELKRIVPVSHACVSNGAKARPASTAMRVGGGLLLAYVAVAHASGELLEETQGAEHIRDTDRAHVRYLAKTAAAVSGTALVVLAANPVVACSGVVVVIAGPVVIDVVTGKTTITEALQEIRNDAIVLWEYAKDGYRRITDAETYGRLREQLNWESISDGGRRLARASWTVVRDSTCRVRQAVGSTMTWGWTRCGDAVRSVIGASGDDVPAANHPGTLISEAQNGLRVATAPAP